MPRKKHTNKPGTPRNKRDGRPRGRHSRGGNDRNNDANQQNNDGFEIKLKAMAHGGYALGTHKGRTTFVPYTIPGETVRVRVVDQQKSVDFAQGVQLVAASADRVYPQCPHFGPGKCWGCQWQHINYKAQLLLKQDVLVDQLYRLGQFDDATLERAIKPVIAAPERWHYNHHITFERDKNGQFGLPRMDNRTIVPVEICHVLHPDLQALYEMLDIDFEDLQRLSLYRGSDGDTMILLTMNSEDVPQLTADMPTSINVVLPDNEPVNLVGTSLVNFEVGGRAFRMTAGGYFRANLPQIENLIATILQMLQLDKQDAVLDLYAGVGVFSAFLAPRAGLVTMVESYPPMATDAEENLSAFENVDIIEGSVEDVLQVIIENGEVYEAAVLDPPPSGLSKDAMNALITLNMPRLVYVSSDPAQLARDGRTLAKNGYTLAALQPIDFAPQTYYIDAVALFTK